MNRAYRITFCHKVGKFVIEIQGPLALYWSPSRNQGKVQHFDTYAEAHDHVDKIGLAAIYTDCTKGSPWQLPQRSPDTKNSLPSYRAASGVLTWPTLEKQA